MSARASLSLSACTASVGTRQCHYRMTPRVTVVVWVIPPPVAVMVIVWFPIAEFLPTLTVIVEVPVPGAAMELGLKVTVCPLP